MFISSKSPAYGAFIFTRRPRILEYMKPVLVSGIQPSGKLHIGNYLGALANFVKLQNSGKYECFFFIADLHSMTEEYAPKEKPKQVMDLAADFLAAGLDPKKSTIFLQSQIPAHSELSWILNTITPMGELTRMTQFKDKSSVTSHESSVNVGLFSYPVLMAADILLYDAKVVPVGDDQDQHLELARTLVRKFNNKFGKTFIEPNPLHTDVMRMMSLDDPTKKMSKSRPAGCLFLDDSPADIRKKVMSATTDSGKEIRAEIPGKEGIGNLLMLYAAISGKTGTALEKQYAGKGYGEFKRDLAEAVVQFLGPLQARKRKVTSTAVKAALVAGGKKANARAEKKLAEVKKRIGLSL
jgi:tryptophanyl-tRNA synthetase